MKKRKLFAIVAIFIVVAVVLFAASCGSPYDGQRIAHSANAAEWVSIDGVHYWRVGYGMAPRYDHDGNLVID